MPEIIIPEMQQCEIMLMLHRVGKAFEEKNHLFLLYHQCTFVFIACDMQIWNYENAAKGKWLEHGKISNYGAFDNI